jgi:arabinogalactan oligomer/maltooligosaccharide transport system substrate-binding protein
MRTNLKRLAAIGAFALLLTACGGGDDGGSGSSGNPEDVSGSITFWDTSNTSEQPTFKQLVGKFTTAYPNVQVTYTPVPFESANQKFTTAAQAGSGAPDVFRSDVGWVPQFAQKQFLLDVAGTYAGEGLDGFLPGPLATGVYDGKQYGVPQVTDAPALLYNKALLEKAGVDVPTTWDEVSAAAAKFKAAGVDTLQTVGDDTYFIQSWLFGDGGALVNSVDKTITVNDPESVSGMQTRLDMQNEGVIVKDLSADAYNNMMTAFKAGTVAMITNGPWSVPDVLTGDAFKDDPTNLGIATMPGGTETGSSPVGGHDYVIYAGSEATDAAALFVQYMASAESQAFISSQLPLLPTQAAAYTDSTVTGGQAADLITAFQPVMDAATARPSVPIDLFTASVRAEMGKILAGSTPVQTGLDAIASEYLKGLESYDYTDE